MKFLTDKTKIDLHMHTSWSDGKCQAEELLVMAKEAGLEVLSITDHDTIEVYNELKSMDVKKFFSGKIIVGMEVNLNFEGRRDFLIYDFEVEKFLKVFGFKQSGSRAGFVSNFPFSRVVKLCRKIGAKIVLAHPFYYTDSYGEVRGILEKLKPFIHGVECVHDNHTPEQIEFLFNYAEGNNIIATGGSDFHRFTRHNKFGQYQKGPGVIWGGEKKISDFFDEKSRS